MNRLDVLKKIKERRKKVGLTIENIAKISKLGDRTVVRFFSGQDVKLSTLEKITNIMGLDFSGNEVIEIEKLKEKRAKKKALYIVSLVQDTSALELQGLEKNELDILIEETKNQFLFGKYQKNLWLS